MPAPRFSQAPTGAGVYTVVASFAGSADYTSASAQVSLSIAGATPTVAIIDAGGTYTGKPFAAVASVAGVNGIAGSTLEGVGLSLAYFSGATLLSGAPSAAGSYTVTATFAGSADYIATSVQTCFRIAKATPVVACFDAGGTFNGSPFAATSTVAGISTVPAASLEGSTPSLSYYSGSASSGASSPTPPTNAGTYTVVASFGGSADYVSASAQTTFTIALHATTTTLSLSSPMAEPYQTVTLTASVVGGLTAPNVPRGTVQFQVDGALYGSPVAIGLNGVAAVTWSSAAAGPHTVTALYSGDANFAMSTAAGATQTINKAGIYVVGTTLYVIGANTSDFAAISPSGSRTDGSTGLKVSATLNSVYYSVSYVQAFTAIVIVGYDGNDNFQLTSSLTLATTVYEGNGNDYLLLGGGNDTVALGTGSSQVQGGGGNKSITAVEGTGAAVSVQLGDGNDVVALGGGKDNVQLGNGNDTVTVGGGADNVQLGNGNNVVTTGNGNNNIQLGNGSDAVAAGNGIDNIQLGNGNDFVSAGNGNDNIQLGNGNDSVVAGNGTDNIQLGNGNNSAAAGNGNDNIQMGYGNDVVTAGNGVDNIQLGNGNDVVTAGNGNDNIQLGNGNDSVTAGDGNDTIQLGNGDNVIVEGNGTDYVSAGNGANLVVGGLGQHTIQLGNGNNILVDGTVSLTQAGDSLRQILTDWKASGAAAVNARLKVTCNTVHPNVMKSGSGRNWFFATYSGTSTNRKATDRLN